MLTLRYAIALGILGVSLASNAQLLNGGFESGSLTPWFQSDNHDPDDNWHLSTQSHSGDFSATISANNPLRQNFQEIPTAQIVSLTFWMRNTDSQESGVNIRYSDSSITPFIAYFDSPEWKLFSVTDLLSPGKSLSSLEIYGHAQGPPNSTYLDDVELNLVPEPASGIALISGALMFARFQRKST